jgi:hypothetical protein
MPTLRQLDAALTKYRCEAVDPAAWIDGVRHTNGKRETFTPVRALADADGVWFVCPKCWQGDGHRVRIGFAGRAAPGTYGHNSKGEPVLWNLDPTSTGIDDLALSPSVQIEGGCNWHGWVGSNGVPRGCAQ